MHAWAVPEAYAVLAAAVEASVVLAGGVEASVLVWPASVVRLVGGSAAACGAALEELCAQCPVHNVVVLGEEAFVFVRSPTGEVSPAVPDLKIGAIQLLGVMVVDTAAQFEAASVEGAIDQALRDTSYDVEPLSELIARVAARLAARALAV